MGIPDDIEIAIAQVDEATVVKILKRRSYCHFNFASLAAQH